MRSKQLFRATFASVHITNIINLGKGAYGNGAHTAGVRTCLSECEPQHTRTHRPVAWKEDVTLECERSKLRTSDFTTVTRRGFTYTYNERFIYIAVNDLQQPD